jgi:phosphopantetheinyl transferase
VPIFFQQQINDFTRLGIWKIEETEEFFKGNVPQHRDVTHPRKRLQHLAGRFLLQFLAPTFPYELIQIADTRKPFLPDAAYRFSISHCGDFAAAIVSTRDDVGIDIEIPVPTIEKIRDKFLSKKEQEEFFIDEKEITQEQLTILWSSKEAVFKWYGLGNVDFKKHIQLHSNKSPGIINCFFEKNETNLQVHYQGFSQIVLAWVVSGKE